MQILTLEYTDPPSVELFISGVSQGGETILNTNYITNPLVAAASPAAYTTVSPLAGFVTGSYAGTNEYTITNPATSSSTTTGAGIRSPLFSPPAKQLKILARVYTSTAKTMKIQVHNAGGTLLYDGPVRSYGANPAGTVYNIVETFTPTKSEQMRVTVVTTNAANTWAKGSVVTLSRLMVTEASPNTEFFGGNVDENDYSGEVQKGKSQWTGVPDSANTIRTIGGGTAPPNRFEIYRDYGTSDAQRVRGDRDAVVGPTGYIRDWDAPVGRGIHYSVWAYADDILVDYAEVYSKGMRDPSPNVVWISDAFSEAGAWPITALSGTDDARRYEIRTEHVRPMGSSNAVVTVSGDRQQTDVKFVFLATEESAPIYREILLKPIVCFRPPARAQLPGVIYGACDVVELPWRKPERTIYSGTDLGGRFIHGAQVFSRFEVTVTPIVPPRLDSMVVINSWDKLYNSKQTWDDIERRGLTWLDVERGF